MTADLGNCPTTIKRRGRPPGKKNGETAAPIRAAITNDDPDVKALTDRFERMTVRQVFYQLETQGVVEKSVAGYRLVQRQVLEMRRKGLLDWDFITDGTRWQRKPVSYTDATDYIAQVSRSYRRDLWQSQKVRIEIWLEKDALADVVTDTTDAWDVSLMVSRGQSSDTFLHSAAEAARDAWLDHDVSTFVYTLYDSDESGEIASEKIEEGFHTFAPLVPITVERLAVTPEQIKAWGLSTRSSKKKNGMRPKWKYKRSCELDAIDPTTLVALVEDAIVSHIDGHAWEIEQAVEAEENKGLLAMAEAWEAS